MAYGMGTSAPRGRGRGREEGREGGREGGAERGREGGAERRREGGRKGGREGRSEGKRGSEGVDLALNQYHASSANAMPLLINDSCPPSLSPSFSLPSSLLRTRDSLGRCVQVVKRFTLHHQRTKLCAQT
jgi:hypothetical protein